MSARLTFVLEVEFPFGIFVLTFDDTTNALYRNVGYRLELRIRFGLSLTDGLRSCTRMKRRPD